MVTYYDEISLGYVELHREEQMKKIKVIKQHLKIRPNSKVLDVGCGPCFADWRINLDDKPIKNIEVTGIDPSKELLKLVKLRSIKLFQGRAEALPFNDASFDYVVSITAIQNFDDIEKGIKEMKRVLKDDGAAVITYLKNSKKAEKIDMLLRKHFNIKETIEEEKDVMFFMSKLPAG